MKKIIVTGANGYLGTGIVTELLNDQNTVIAVDDHIGRIDERAIKVQCDIFNSSELKNCIDKHGIPNILLHLAWKDGFNHSSEAHLKYLDAHYKFVEHCVNMGIKQIAIMGSVHEIGFYEGSVNENTPTNPQSLYGIAKNALRQSAELLCKNENVIFQWIRGFYIVGNSEYGSSLFSKIIQAEKRGETEFPFTNGINQFDFLDYDVFCKYVSLIIQQSKINGIINCCSGVPERISDRAEKFIKGNGLNIKLKYGAFKERPYDSKAIWGDDSKLKGIIETYEARTSC